MTLPSVTALDLRVIEEVLQMESGYVLDFTDRSFTTFFEDFGLNISEDRYCADGLSKAKRLRRFLRTGERSLVGHVLKGLFEYRMTIDPQSVSEGARVAYERIVDNLLGPQGGAEPQREGSAQLALDRQLRPEDFSELPIDADLRSALLGRVMEAQSCMKAGAHLAVVILCGSVLEGMCMGFGANDAARARAAFVEKFRRQPPERLGDWTLFEWLAVLRHLDALSPTVEKYGHALRDFRNYVHPAQQLRTGFAPDQHNARIALQVVLAAAADLTKNAGKGPGDG